MGPSENLTNADSTVCAEQVLPPDHVLCLLARCRAPQPVTLPSITALQIPDKGAPIPAPITVARELRSLGASVPLWRHLFFSQKFGSKFETFLQVVISSFYFCPWE